MAKKYSDKDINQWDYNNKDFGRYYHSSHEIQKQILKKWYPIKTIVVVKPKAWNSKSDYSVLHEEEYLYASISSLLMKSNVFLYIFFDIGISSNSQNEIEI